MSMQMEFIKVLPSPQALMEDYPVSKASKLLKLQRDEAIKNIFTGKDDRFLLVIGPCSSDNEDAVLDYVYRLAKLQEKVQDKIFIVPRLYTNKPRTIGVGYKGMLHQPSPEGEEDMLGGIIAIRKMNVRVVEETGLTGAEEILYDDKVAKISIVGAGMESHAGVATKMFEALYDAQVNIQMISTSEIKVSVLIDSADADKAVSAIHSKFFD